MKHELRQMREQGSGAIVNCSSIGGVRGGGRAADYHSSKHAIIGLTRSVAQDYASRGVRINAVCPGTIETPMVSEMMAKGQLEASSTLAKISMGRYGRPDELPPPCSGCAARARVSSPASHYWSTADSSLVYDLLRLDRAAFRMSGSSSGM